MASLKKVEDARILIFNTFLSAFVQGPGFMPAYEPGEEVTDLPPGVEALATRRGRRNAQRRRYSAGDEEDDDDDDEEGMGESGTEGGSSAARSQRRRSGARARKMVDDDGLSDDFGRDDEGGSIAKIDRLLGRRWVIPRLELLAERRARRREERLWAVQERREIRRLEKRLEDVAVAIENRRKSVLDLEQTLPTLPAREAQFHEEYRRHQQELHMIVERYKQEDAQLTEQWRQRAQAFQQAMMANPMQMPHLTQMFQREQAEYERYKYEMRTQTDALYQRTVAAAPQQPPTQQDILEQRNRLNGEIQQLMMRQEHMRRALQQLPVPTSPQAGPAAGAAAAAAAGAGGGGGLPAAAGAGAGGEAEAHRWREHLGPVVEDKEEDEEDDERRLAAGELPLPSFADPHWQYLIKPKGKSLIHCEWWSRDEVEADHPPYGRQRLCRYLARLKRQAHARGEDFVEDPTTDGGEGPDMSEWSLEDYLDPAQLEVEKILAVAPIEGMPEEATRRPELMERFCWRTCFVDIVDRLERFRWGGIRVAFPFMQPVNPDLDGCPDYLDVIKHPMDLGTIRDRLNEVEAARPYTDPSEVVRDVEQVWANCREYNYDPEHDVRIMGDALSDEWHRQYAHLQHRLKICGGQFRLLFSNHGPRKFLVKWKGLSYADCSWEREEDVDDDAAVEAYYRANTIPPGPTAPRKQYPGGAPKQAVYQQSPEYKDGRELRSYQLEGLNWLIYSWRNSRNCILADEMGLGKTAQAIAFLRHLYENENDQGPYLIVVPLSTVGHWRREVEAWSDFRLCVYHDTTGGGSTRERIRTYEWYYYQRRQDGSVFTVPNKYKFDVLVTTYEIAIADVEELKHVNWTLLVVDEGQRLKNRNNKLIQVLQELNVPNRLLLTGTPLQNSTSELWSLLNFIEPDKFRSREEFEVEYGDLRTKEQVEKLSEVMRPHILRRLKEHVEKSIPRKEETIIDVELTLIQKQYYRALFERNRAFLTRGQSSKTKAAPALLNLETELRKCCNHPFLVAGVEERETAQATNMAERMVKLVRASGKMILLEKLLPKLRTEGHKVLIFSQMTRMLDLLERFCRFRRYSYERIDGSIRGNARQAAIDRFQDPANDTFVFLLSTRAGGVGVTLTAADTVIIFDSDWNPQNDIQAQARAHRIGQTKEVKIYRLLTRDTYEATMFQRASKKLGLEQAVMGGGTWDGGEPRKKGPSKVEVERLLRLGAYATLTDNEDQAAAKSRAFEETDIDALLARGKVVTLDPVRGNEELDESTSQLLNFSKTSFGVGEEGDAVDMNDPDFWEKVLGADARSTLRRRLNDGTVLKSAKEKEAFLQELGQAKEDIRTALEDGHPVPNWADQVTDCLLAITSQHKDSFSEDQQQRAAAMLQDMESRKRRRRSSGFGGRGGRSPIRLPRPPGSANNGGDEDYVADEVEGLLPGDLSDSSGAGRRRGKKRGIGEASEDEDDDDYEESGGKRGPLSDCSLKVPLCALTLRSGGDLLLCDGACLRYLSPEAARATQEDAEADRAGRAADKRWMCADCDKGYHRCFACGVAGPVSDTAPANADNLDDQELIAISRLVREAQRLMSGQPVDPVVAWGWDGKTHLEPVWTDAARLAEEEEAKATEAKRQAARERARIRALKKKQEKEGGGGGEGEGEGEEEDEEGGEGGKAGPGSAAAGASAQVPAAAGAGGEEKKGSKKEGGGRGVVEADSVYRPAPLPSPEQAADLLQGLGSLGERPSDEQLAQSTLSGGGAAETDPGADRPVTAAMLARMNLRDFLQASQRALGTLAVGPDGEVAAPSAERPVWQCTVTRCGRYYCMACIRALDRVHFVNKGNMRKFRCPLHCCAACGRTGDAQPILQDIAAPLGYHVRCLPEEGHPMRPVRVSRKFIINAVHPRKDAAKESADRNVALHNANEPVPGRLTGKEVLQGQAGSSGSKKKGTIRTKHALGRRRKRRREDQPQQPAAPSRPGSAEGAAVKVEDRPAARAPPPAAAPAPMASNPMAPAGPPPPQQPHPAPSPPSSGGASSGPATGGGGGGGGGGGMGGAAAEFDVMQLPLEHPVRQFTQRAVAAGQFPNEAAAFIGLQRYQAMQAQQMAMMHQQQQQQQHGHAPPQHGAVGGGGGGGGGGGMMHHGGASMGMKHEPEGAPDPKRQRLDPGSGGGGYQ